MAGLALVLAGAILGPGMARAEQVKESFVQDDIRKTGSPPFYFGRISFSIMAPHPVVDWDSVGAYATLAELPRFYIGRVDAEKRLTWLETWRRHPLTLDPEMVVAGRPLPDHDVPVRLQGNRILSQTPVFFMQDEEDRWQRVPVEATEGESRFIRLRWLPGLEEDDPVSLTAELFEQRPETVEAYVYDATGRLAETYRQDAAGDMQPVPHN